MRARRGDKGRLAVKIAVGRSIPAMVENIRSS
jgi:hypothetical protein